MDMRICIIAFFVLVLSACGGPADTGTGESPASTDTDQGPAETTSGESSDAPQNASTDTSASSDEDDVSTAPTGNGSAEPVQQVNETEKDMDMQELESVEDDLDFTI